MTSKEHITQLVDEAVDNRKGVTLKKNDDHQKKKLSYQKTVRQQQFQNWHYSFVITKTLCKFHGLKYYLLFVLLLIFHS